MTITRFLRVAAIVLMAIAVLVLAAWASTFWATGIGFLGGLLPSGSDPIAVALRGWLPTIRSAGTVIVLVVAGILGWSLGRKIWTA